MKVRCPGCEAVFLSDERGSACPHKRIDSGYVGMYADIRRPPPEPGIGWCEIHGAWDCQEMHGDPSEA